MLTCARMLMCVWLVLLAAFIMSQTKEWRDKNILAFVAVSPVFGGTVSSLHSVLAGWKSGGMDICSGQCENSP